MNKRHRPRSNILGRIYSILGIRPRHAGLDGPVPGQAFLRLVGATASSSAAKLLDRECRGLRVSGLCS